MRNKTNMNVVHRAMMALVCLMAFASTRAEERITLRVWFADGTTTDVQLYTRPQVTFQDDKVVITSPIATFTYDAQQVLRFTYAGGKTPIKVENAKADAAYHQKGELILFDAKVKASDVQLFTEDGKRLSAKVTNVNGRPTLSLTALPAGVYLLKVNGRTSKILKK